MKYLLVKGDKIEAYGDRPFVEEHLAIHEEDLPPDFATDDKPLRHWRKGIDISFIFLSDDLELEKTTILELMELETLKKELEKEMFDIHIGQAISQDEIKKDRYIELATKYNKL
jgi:hypothetical protein